MSGHPSMPEPPSQSPQLPDEGTLMAVYDKSGYSHSETSLTAVIYMSQKVRPQLPHGPVMLLPAGTCAALP